MTVPCEGQLLLLTPPFDGLTPEPIVLGTMKSCPGLVDEHGTQVSSCTSSCGSLCISCALVNLALGGPDCLCCHSFNLLLNCAPGSQDPAPCASLHSALLAISIHVSIMFVQNCCRWHLRPGMATCQSSLHSSPPPCLGGPQPQCSTPGQTAAPLLLALLLMPTMHQDGGHIPSRLA